MIRLIKATAAFLACPGVVAGALPWLWVSTLPNPHVIHTAGLGLLVVGVGALLWCVRDFYAFGKGTLAPWDPPQHLVTTGLYRYSRNPMYVSVSVTLFGWALTFASGPLLGYALLVVLAFELRVVFGEEPWLLSTHGAAWVAYKARVRRWL